MNFNDKIKGLESNIEILQTLVKDLIKMVELLDSKARFQQRLLNLLVNRLDGRELYDELNLPEISELLKKEGIDLNLVE